MRSAWILVAVSLALTGCIDKLKGKKEATKPVSSLTEVTKLSDSTSERHGKRLAAAQVTKVMVRCEAGGGGSGEGEAAAPARLRYEYATAYRSGVLVHTAASCNDPGELLMISMAAEEPGQEGAAPAKIGRYQVAARDAYTESAIDSVVMAILGDIDSRRGQIGWNGGEPAGNKPEAEAPKEADKKG